MNKPIGIELWGDPAIYCLGHLTRAEMLAECCASEFDTCDYESGYQGDEDDQAIYWTRIQGGEFGFLGFQVTVWAQADQRPSKWPLSTWAAVPNIHG